MVKGNSRLDTTTNKGQIYIIVCTIVALAVICVSTVCYMCYVSKEPSQGMWLLTGGLVGSLTSMLTKTTPTESIKTQTTAVHPAPSTPTADGGTPPTEVTVVNSPSEPVPTTETPKT